jgi:cysteinyl-tRNA synthetase
MSKSAGNVVLLKDVIDRGFDPLAVRLCFLENRYRSQMDLTWASIEAADATLKRWRKKIKTWGTQNPVKDAEFLEILNNDLDTPKAIQYLRTLEKNENINNRSALFLFADQILGLDLAREEVVSALSSEQEEILKLRQIARNEKRWADSDELRVKLEQSGLEIMDGPDGQTWNWR